MNTDSQLSKQKACFARVIQVCLIVNYNTSVTFFDVRSVLHEQVSLTAVNQICVIYEAMDGYKNLKIN